MRASSLSPRVVKELTVAVDMATVIVQYFHRLRKVPDGDDVKALLASLESGDWKAADQELISAWRKISKGVIRTSGNAEWQWAGRFDLDNPYVREWLEFAGAQFVTHVVEGTRAAVKETILRGVDEHEAPRVIARRLRGETSIGLLPEHQLAVDRLLATALASGASEAEALRTAQAYARRLLKYRTENIARTEVVGAQSAGKQASWSTARAKGFLTSDSKKRWVAGQTDRTCPICQAFDGVEANVSESFVSRDGVERMHPTAHPSCRCTIVLVTPKRALWRGPHSYDMRIICDRRIIC